MLPRFTILLRYFSLICTIMLGCTLIHQVHASWKDDIKQAIQEIVPSLRSDNVDEIDILRGGQTLFFQIIGIITIVMILYVALKFLLAKGSAEEFKREAKALLYIIAGLVVIPLSYFLIRFLTDLKL